MQNAQAIHKSIITIDTHVDIPSQDYATEKIDPGMDHPQLRCDLVKMEKGGVKGVFLAVFIAQKPELNKIGYQKAREIADKHFKSIHRLTETMHPNRCELALSAEDVKRIAKSGKRAIMIGLENGYPVGEDISFIDTYFEYGARYITLCHTRHNQICDSSNPKEKMHHGLSEFGKQLVKKMNQKGMMVDVSHISEESFFDVIKLSKAPIIASHSGCSGVYSHNRNLTDAQLLALKENGGVIQIVGYGGYLKAETETHKEMIQNLRNELKIPPWSERQKLAENEMEKLRPRLQKYWQSIRQINEENPVATVKDFADHIDHAVKIAGINHVGIGTDFDGGGGIGEFQTHAQAFNVTLELVRRGYTKEQIKKIWGGNLLRVWQEVEKCAK